MKTNKNHFINYMQHPNDNQNEVVSLKDIIKKFRYLISLLVHNFKLILTGILIIVIVTTSYFVLRPTKYIAVTTFVLDQSGSSFDLLNLGASLLGSSGSNLDEKKTIAVLETRVIVSGALLKKAIINNKNDFLVNHLIELYEFRSKWENSDRYPNLENVLFTGAQQEKFTLTERYVIGSLSSFVSKELLSVANSTNGIISVNVATKNEEFSKQLCDAMIHVFDIFYAKNTVGNQRDIVINLELKLDSVKNELVKSELKLAKWKDESLRLIKAQGYLEEIRLTRDVQVLNVLYGEVIKNIEAFKAKLMMKKPTLQVIDSPVIPLGKDSVNIFFVIIISGFLATCTLSAFVILKDMILKNLSEQN